MQRIIALAIFVSLLTPVSVPASLQADCLQEFLTKITIKEEIKSVLKKEKRVLDRRMSQEQVDEFVKKMSDPKLTSTEKEKIILENSYSKRDYNLSATEKIKDLEVKKFVSDYLKKEYRSWTRSLDDEQILELVSKLESKDITLDTKVKLINRNTDVYRGVTPQDIAKEFVTKSKNISDEAWLDNLMALKAKDPDKLEFLESNHYEYDANALKISDRLKKMVASRTEKLNDQVDLINKNSSGFQIARNHRAADYRTGVVGDSLSVATLPNGKIALFVFDGKSHGARAGISALTAQKIFNQIDWEKDLAGKDFTADNIMTLIDKKLTPSFENGGNSASLIVFDPKSKSAEFTGAGVVSSVFKLKSGGEIETIKSPGGAYIGNGEFLSYSTVPHGVVTINLKAGESLVFGTDGLEELAGRRVGDDVRNTNFLTTKLQSDKGIKDKVSEIVNDDSIRTTAQGDSFSLKDDVALWGIQVD